MTKRFGMALTYFTALAVVVVFFDTQSAGNENIIKAQHTKSCPKGTQWRQSAGACLPKQ